MSIRETAVFGGGCFWCTEAIFKRVKGVISVMPGYAGGEKVNPTYQEVCTGKTGHAEVIKIEFDPQVISYEELLEVLWIAHDPTTLNRQGNDVGEQYRSIILFANDDQKNLAERSMRKVMQSSRFSEPLVTVIQPMKEFYPAEDYHQDYFANNPNQPYCRFVISPKLNHFMESYKS